MKRLETDGGVILWLLFYLRDVKSNDVVSCP